MPVPVTPSVLRKYCVRVGGDLRIERICRLEIGAVVGIGQLVHIRRHRWPQHGTMQLVDVIAEGGV